MPKFAVEIDEMELAVRLAEVGCGLKRPEGMSAPAAWAQISTNNPGADVFRRQARAAMLFFSENVANLKPVS